MPDRMQRFVEEGPGKIEGKQRFAGIALFDDSRIQRTEEARGSVMTKADAVALATRFAGRRKASQRSGATRICSVASTCACGIATPPQAAQLRRNDLGIVKDQRIARLQQTRVSHGPTCPPVLPSGGTTRSRAESRGSAGRSAIRSSGRSKSKRSTFIPVRSNQRRRRPRP